MMKFCEQYQQPTWRYWGEEKSDGAIYTVYLKKVRYFNPSKSINSDSDDEIAHLEWETVRVRMVKAATLDRLVERLSTDTGELESSYINVFLATYRTFSTTEEVLKCLLDRYKQLDSQDKSNDKDVNESLRKNIKVTLLVWLDAYPDDFRDPPNYRCLNQMLHFATNSISDGELELRLKHKLEKFIREEEVKMISYDLKDDMKCKSPSINGYCNSTYNFLDISTDTFAEQLTHIDSELFKKVAPHHCLGSVWSRRDKVKSCRATSVVATVEQFNAVSFRVISTVLMDVEMKLSVRARIISKWIDIAQKLRVLKNFSSLKAIISGLQSNPVYRLKKTWFAVPREKVELFDELARIFSEDNNQMTCRELLMKEGTAKVAANVGENDRHLQKVIQRQFGNGATTVQGTIPYLGTFLTDLTMIDTAISDTIGDGLINFDKKRKEFEVLAQIKLLQLAANSYNFQSDHNFQRWFENLPVLDDKESYDISCQIEPQSINHTLKDKKCGLKPVLGHRKTDSIASTSSSSSSQFYDQISDTVSIPSCPHDSSSLERKMSTSSSSSSLPSLDVSVSSLNSMSHSQSSSSSSSPFKTSDFYVIRVSVEHNGQAEIDGVNLYKSIMLSNSEHTPTVIRNAMLKHSLEGDPDDYCLAQLLPDGEIVFPASANVYYAINTAYDLNFILRRKKDDDTPGIKKNKPPKSKKKMISLSV